VTNDVLDFQLIHNQMLAAGEEHYGLIFTSDFHHAAQQGLNLALGKNLGESLSRASSRRCVEEPRSTPSIRCC
jgi:hypothetical protein